jgi:hypothetical protein
MIAHMIFVVIVLIGISFASPPERRIQFASRPRVHDCAFFRSPALFFFRSRMLLRFPRRIKAWFTRHQKFSWQ